MSQTTKSHTRGVIAAAPPTLGQLRSLQLPKQQSFGASVPQGTPQIAPASLPPWEGAALQGDHILAGTSSITLSCDNRKGTGYTAKPLPSTVGRGREMMESENYKAFLRKSHTSGSFQPQCGANSTNRLGPSLANSVLSCNQTCRTCAGDVAQALGLSSCRHPSKAQTVQICPATAAKSFPLPAVFYFITQQKETHIF